MAAKKKNAEAVSVDSITFVSGVEAVDSAFNLGLDEVYDLTKIKAFVFDVDGVLSPATIPVGADGMPVRMVNIKDGYAIQLAVKHGYKIAIITGGVSDLIPKRYNALGVNDVFMGASMKLPTLTQWLENNAITPEEAVYIGDDIPDIECMKAVGLPVAPADAAPELIAAAKYVTKAKGGYGVAREVIERVMKAHGDWMSTEKAFGW